MTDFTPEWEINGCDTFEEWQVEGFPILYTEHDARRDREYAERAARGEVYQFKKPSWWRRVYSYFRYYHIWH